MNNLPLLARRQLRQIIPLLTSLLLVSCATQQTQPLSKNANMPAATSVLTEAVYTNTLFTECEKLGEDVEIEVLSVQQDWLIKNWALVSAADRYFTEQEQPSGILYQGELLSMKAIKLTYDAQQRAIKELNFNQRTTLNQQKFCLSRLKKLAQTEMDMGARLFNKKSPFALDTGSPQSTIDTARVPRLAGSLQLNQQPGRTAFELTEQFQQECAQPEIIVLQNEWPLEAYAAYCNQNPLALVTCEWGKCEQRAN